MAKQIGIQALQPGMFILGIIEQNGPVRIKKTGLVTSQEMVQGLAEMGVVSVAIDPEKTVELEIEDTHHVSQTQFVMQANEESPRQDADNQLTEQFNRSLFMPSLQKVPSAWRYYGTQVGIAALVVFVGFFTGWFASGFANKSSSPVSVSEPVQDTATLVADKPQNPAQSVPVKDSVADNTAQTQAGSIVAAVEPETTDKTQEETAAQNVGEPVSRNLASQNAPSSADTEETVAVTEAAPAAASSAVSPELMKRFEAAMADLEKESSPTLADDGETLEYGRAENTYNSTDIQRVDQLPARIMTRLPSMSFSAHMYASNPNDRWVKLNGIEMGEGEWLDDKLFIERIEPQHVILVFEGHQFSMRALSEW
ncbi:general secretion pathway protein GspB [Planctobacterium marinum]|uniref:general secretion pathway protein GspB n=1 Tax=Planctobacterium marinum TaxID=1631968 RepID=UPI001E3C25BE|nr:general secretion pathway protein GspB [Planctobacterium marinum]MCC2603812.1 general secretion pathway protein GspB [Planctobacterium marinum]